MTSPHSMKGGVSKMKIKKVPIEVYNRLIRVQGNSRVSEDLIVVPFLKELKKEQSGGNKH